jgi:Tol biopolymer transport system component
MKVPQAKAGRSSRRSLPVVLVVSSICTSTSLAGGQERVSPVSAKQGIVREVVKDFVGRGPTISADGRYLAYVGPDNTIRVRELVTGVDRRISPLPTDSSRPNGRLAFSPDGKMIVWGWQGQPGGHPQLRVVSIDGEPANIPYNTEQWPGLGPWGNWSADGKQILTLAIKVPLSVPFTRRIALVSVTDGSIHNLKTLPWQANPSGLSLSPDGRYVTYDYPVAEGSMDRDIFMLPTDGGEDVRLVARATDDYRPSFTPDGRGVLFLSQQLGNADRVEAWFVEVPNGNVAGRPELLNADLGTDATPIGFTRNGSFYYRRGTAILVMDRFLPAVTSR